MEGIDVRDTKDYMIGNEIVSKIYEIRDSFLFDDDEPIEYKTLITNIKVIEAIREVNFIFSKGIILDKIEVPTKVGNLLNFEVYLDPLHEDEVTFVAEGFKDFKLKIQF
jgi:hypothetical protein